MNRIHASKSPYIEYVREELGVTLNDAQAKAVTHTQGQLLLLASPGSGKTTTLILRIGYLIRELGVDPLRIKAVTFSRAAAADMKERYQRFFPGQTPVAFSTIHSFAFEVVRRYFHKKGTAYKIIEGELDADEQEAADPSELPLHKKIILRKLYQARTGETLTDEQMDELTTYISFIKNKLLPEDQWAGVPCDVKQAEAVLRDYEAFKQSGHDKLLVDFDDMLTIAGGVLERDPGLLRHYQSRYDYVLTDESQDTSAVQHALIEKLVRRHGNLCIVADDDQSIYSWRGAEPSYLLSIRQVYPRAATLYMEQNYRSTPDIVSVANRFIKRNKNRYNKNMFTRNAAKTPIQFRTFPAYRNQAKYLVEEIRKEEILREVAVLYRNNASSISLMNEFDRAGIPFYMKDSDNRFFSHWVVEDILNFMRMTYTDRRPELLGTIYRKMNGYITRQQMEALGHFRNQQSVFHNLLKHVPLQDYQVKQLYDIKETFEQMKGMPPLPAIRVIRTRLGYDKAIDKLCERLGFRKEYLVGILNTLEEIADTLESMEAFAARLKALEAALKTSKFNKHTNAVTFSTFHSAKGLEFDRVYMIDLVDGVVPSSEDRKKIQPGGGEPMEEAVRLFYVGMTRAKSHLELLSYRERDGEKAKESPFVADVRALVHPSAQAGRAAGSRTETSHKTGTKRMQDATDSPGSRTSSRGRSGSGEGLIRRKPSLAPPLERNPRAIRDAAQFVAGQAVRHRAFGPGTILEVGGEKLSIRFEAGEKALAIAACLDRGLLEPE